MPGGETPEATAPAGRRAARAYREALADTLRRDPDAFGLRDAMLSAGTRLIDVLEAAGSSGAKKPDGPGEKGDSFHVDFVNRVAGDGTSIAEAAVRRAAAGRAVDRLLDGNAPGVWPSLPGDVFCAVYESFFADAVGEFVKTMIAESVGFSFPVMYAVDPAGLLAEWVAEQVCAGLPRPCSVAKRMGASAPSLFDVARDLLEETVDRALGISGEET